MFSKQNSAEVQGQVFLCLGCGNEFDDEETQKSHEVICAHLQWVQMRYGDCFQDVDCYRKTVCEICRAHFGDSEFLRDHKLLHLNRDNVCYLCDSYHSTFRNLATHVTTNHRDYLGTKQNEEGVNEPYTCYVCVLRFSTLKGLQNHETLHVSDVGTVTCRICCLLLKNDRGTVEDHLASTTHAVSKQKLLNVFTCIHCNTNFATRDSYAMHMMLRAKNENCSAKNLAHEQTAFSSMNNLRSSERRLFIKIEPNLNDDIADSSAASLDKDVNKDTPLSENKNRSNAGLREDIMLPSRAKSSVEKHYRMNRVTRSLMRNWIPKNVYSLSIPNPYNPITRKTCDKCCRIFYDTDDLAMHTMSEHTHAETSPQQDSSRLKVRNPILDALPRTKTLNPVESFSQGNYPTVNSRLCDSRSNMHDLRYCSKIEHTQRKRPSSAPLPLNDDFSVRRPKQPKPFRGNRKLYDAFESTYSGRRYSPVARKGLEYGTNEENDSNPVYRDTKQIDSEKRSAADSCIKSTKASRETNIPGCENLNAVATERSHIAGNEKEYIKEALKHSGDNVWMCKYCSIIFLDKTMFCLHMGVHNVDSPYKCNMCGYQCLSVHEFSAHVLHFR